MSVTSTRSPCNTPSRSLSNDRSRDPVVINFTLPSGFTAEAGKRASQLNSNNRSDNSERQSLLTIRHIANEDSSLNKKGVLQVSNVEAENTTTAVPPLDTLADTDSKISKPSTAAELAFSATVATSVPTISESTTILPNLTAIAADKPSKNVPLSTTAVDQTAKISGPTTKISYKSPSKPQSSIPLPKSTIQEPRMMTKVPDSTTISATKKSGTRPSDVSFGTTSFTSTTLTPQIPRVTLKDIESLREYVRMDNGLPLTRQYKRKSVRLFGQPPMQPKMNRASLIRSRFIRTAPAENRRYTSCGSSIPEWQQEDALKHLKQLADRYKRKEIPAFRFNRGFEMRYQSNKGDPAIPSSFRESYELYNKPIFRVPKRLELPKRYLWPQMDDNRVSYLGLRMDVAVVPLQYRSKPRKSRNWRKRRPILRPIKVQTPKHRPHKVIKHKDGKPPWNYGGR